MNWQTSYVAPQQTLWQGRADDKEAQRLYETIKCLDLRKALKNMPAKAIGLIGFACDVGVKRNQGRTGAAQGMQAFRKVAGNLPLSLECPAVYDCGDIVCQNDDLETAQLALAQVVALVKNAQLIPCVIGGGHETAWGHFQGLMQAQANKELCILNFDAHFDLRSLLENDLGTSGSPFFQIAQYCREKSLSFDYHVLGLQKAANTLSLFETAKKLQVDYLEAQNLHQDFTLAYPYLDKIIAKQKPIYISLCLDVFNSAIAPGVSAPQINGLFAWQVIACLRYLKKQSVDINAIDIVELAPCHDKENTTAKLAANLFFEFL